jgi:DNA-binding beta-propeller fold protein YncE
VSIACAALAGTPPVLALYAGTLGAGAADGSATSALFNAPSALAADASGNVYVADTNNNTIRKIAPGGAVTTLAGAAGVAGGADGTGAAATFNGPGAIATDSSGNVYVADTFNDTIRMITPAGVVTTIAGSAGVAGAADGTGAAASFNLPSGIAVNSTTGTIYVADYNNSTIRAIAPGGVVTTLAGTPGRIGAADGSGAAAEFDGPQGMALDASGNIYVADTYNQTVREVTPAGLVTTFAGTPEVAGAADGATTAATFYYPLDVAFDGSGNLYVADNGNDLVREISGGTVSTIVGTAGQNVFSAGTLPGSLQNPTSVVLSGTSLYVTTINAVAVVTDVP